MPALIAPPYHTTPPLVLDEGDIDQDDEVVYLATRTLLLRNPFTVTRPPPHFHASHGRMLRNMKIDRVNFKR